MTKIGPVTLLCALLLLGCGGHSGTLTLQIVVAPGNDPFLDATQARFTVGQGLQVSTVPVTQGHFQLALKVKPSQMPNPVFVEALDAQGNVVAHGQTPSLTFPAQDQGPIAIWVGRPGKLSAAAASLPGPRVEEGAAAITGMGILYAGGRDQTGAPVAEACVYDVFTHSVIDSHVAQGLDLAKPIAGATLAPITSYQAVLYAGSSSPGFGSTAMVDAGLQLFDPRPSGTHWAPLAADPIGGRAYAARTILANGTILVSGGVDGSGLPLASAGLISPAGVIQLSKVATPMAAARRGHAAVAAHFPDGDGALLFGGLGSGVTTPVAERLIGQSFVAYDLGATPSRSDATATAMPSGELLILGGTSAAGALASGLVVKPTLPAATVVELPMALSVARTGHTATLVAGGLLVCGGSDGRAVQASCDLLDTMTYERKGTVAMVAARRGHTAELLETGVVVLAGGFGAGGDPLNSLELYTP